MIDGAGQFEGGRADELAVARGNSARLDGGAGDDLLFSENGGATMIGGAGDDFIDATAIENEYDQATNQNSGGPDSFVDVIDAGDGDDRVEDVANGDRVTLGAGSDLATGWYDRSIDLEAVTFTDFDPSEDRVILSLLGFDTDQTGDLFEDFDLTGRIEILEADGDSHLFVDDTLVAVFENTAGLTAVSQPFIDESREIYEARLVIQ